MPLTAQILPPPIEQLINFIASDAFVKAVIFPGVIFVSVFGLFTVWYERKLLARVMLRIGPLHVGKYAGLLQVVADTVKFLAKEYIVPETARRRLFVLMPMLGVVINALLFAFLPFGPMWLIFPSDISILLFFVLVAISPLPLILAGWASGNKYSLIGIVRFAFQIFAYEIPLFLALTGVIVMARSFDIVKIVEAQASMPFIVPQIIGFLAFFITLVSEVERIPFDMPTAEQELVEGWMVEFSSYGFLMLQLANYLKLDALVVLTALLYLGGWYGPAIPGIPDFILAPLWVLLKSLVILAAILLLRGTYPRITIKKILDLGWRVLIPMTLLNLLIVSVIMTIPQLL
ncbi:MAG: NADH-quinone oxidoreductase subunit H [Aigarchaeota archaeon]|nr:NADH-quinone oxidoreductase subunit H [Candidatus Pelearchaeum maunauluense]